MVRLAVKLGVAKLGELCIDGTRVLANASRFNTLTAEKAERLLAELDQQILLFIPSWRKKHQMILH